MGYKMIEITQEKKGELMEHAEKAYEHIGKMLECVESMDEGNLGMRGDEWYIRKMGMRNRGGYGMRYGMRDDEMDDMDNYGSRYGMRRGGGRYGNRDPYFY